MSIRAIIAPPPMANPRFNFPCLIGLMIDFKPGLKSDIKPGLKSDIQPDLKSNFRPGLKSDIRPGSDWLHTL